MNEKSRQYGFPDRGQFSVRHGSLAVETPEPSFNPGNARIRRIQSKLGVCLNGDLKYERGCNVALADQEIAPTLSLVAAIGIAAGCLLSAEVRKHSGRTTLRVRIEQSGSQLVSVFDRAARAAPL